MVRRSFIVAGLVLVLASTVTTAQQQLWVTIRTADGRDVMGFAARSEPYRQGMRPRVSETFTEDHGVRDRQGRIVSGIAFYGWTEGSNVRVVVLARVPVDGAANRFYPGGNSASVKLEEFAVYTLRAGESRRIDELKAAGMEPMSIRVDARAPPSDKPVTSATARVIRKPVDAHFIHVENRRDVPLVEWRIELRSAENRRMLSTGRDYRGGFGLPEGPIAPHERRQERLTWRGERLAATAAIKLVVFADGSHAGSPEGVAEFRREQEALITDLTYWQRTLQELPRTSVPAAQQYLREKARERALVDDSDPSIIRGSIESWFGPNRPSDWPFMRANHALREIAERLADATSYRKHVNSDTAPEHAVAVWTASGQGTDFFAVVENLRDTPLEAFQLEMHDPLSPNAVAGFGSDACVNLNDAGPDGRLNRNETREIGIRPADDRLDDAAPRAVLSFALWKDLSWEGSRDEHDRLLEAREQRAELYAFWIAALKEAARKPADDRLRFLRQKREERRREFPDETDSLMRDNLEIWTKRGSAEPGAVPGWLDAYRTTLEQQHALLTRHLRK
jgi:hypothetical protein